MSLPQALSLPRGSSSFASVDWCWRGFLRWVRTFASLASYSRVPSRSSFYRLMSGLFPEDVSPYFKRDLSTPLPGRYTCVLKSFVSRKDSRSVRGAEPAEGNVSEVYVHVFRDWVLRSLPGRYFSALICFCLLDLEILAGLLLKILAQFGQIHWLPLLFHPHIPASCLRSLSSMCSIFLLQF